MNATYKPYFDKAEKSVFRFEGLQDYSAMDGDVPVNHFKKSGELLRHPRDSKWWQGMQQKNQSGIITQRVRLVTLPLIDYTKWELDWH